MNFHARLWTPIVALCAALVLAGATAEAAPSALAQACGKDIKSLCGNVKPGRGALKACVESHYKELSADCQVAIVRTAAIGRDCKADIKAHCSSAKTGKDRAACLKQNETSLTAACKEAVNKADSEE